MSTTGDALTEKVGPLPVWVWGISAGIAINAGRYFYGRRKTKNAALTTDPAADTGTAGAAGAPDPTSGPGAPASGNYGYGANAPASSTGSDQATAPATGRPVTNVVWQAQAVDALTAGGAPPLAATEALRKYLAGEPTTTIEQGLVSLAIRSHGVPPEGAPALLTVPPTTTPSNGTAAPTPPAPPAIAPVWNPAGGQFGLWPINSAKPTIRQGTTGDAVRYAQGVLTKNGIRTNVDGVFGPSTDRSVRSFQTSHGLTVDGVIGAATWSALDRVA